MERLLTVQDAGLRTATVEIKGLVVNNKQMTLAVFKQLMRGRLVDEVTGEYRGVPWGWVNHHSKDCWLLANPEPFRTHLHVIWQDGDQLRVDTVASKSCRYSDLRSLEQLFIAV
jgi:hypothetical protein